MHDAYRSALNYVESRFPNVAHAIEHHLPSPLLFSNYNVEIADSDLKTIERFVAVIEKVKTDIHYQSSIALNPLAKKPVRNHSIFTCFDFHITDVGPKLIEINTNASLYFWSAILNEVNRDKFKIYGLNPIEQIKEMLEAEFLTTNLQNPKLAIVDESPKEQRAYAEFLAYQALFNGWGWPTEILDIGELKFATDLTSPSGTRINFVYNRSTDFYFESPASSQLKAAYAAEASVFSPNPREYGLIADKVRLLDLRDYKNGLSSAEVDLLRNVIPDCGLIQNLPHKELKKQRQKYFFKPLNSHGGKAVYSGKTISNKMFSEIETKPYLYQEIVPPAILHTSPAEKWKWDLRVYVYNSHIQQMIARVYQGQTTNSRTEGGGAAVVHCV
jgi:hypothetical protein